MKEKYQVQILKQDHFGNGIGKKEEKLIFVENALSGEVCDIEIIEDKKNFQRAKVIKRYQDSPNRVVPPCPYITKCGGCKLQHESYEAQLAWKESKIKELLTRYALYQGEIEPIKSLEPFAYRNKVTFKVLDHHLALTEENSNHLVKIEKCLLLPPAMNRLIVLVNDYLKGITPFQELQIRMNHREEFLVSIKGELEKEVLIKALAKEPIITIYQNHQIIYGSAYFFDEILGMKFFLSDTSFFQVNRNLTETLYQLVLDEVKKTKPTRLLDLYCGTGTLGLLASQYCTEVIGVEVVESAISDANKNKKVNNVKNITFYQGRVEDKIEELKESDFVIVDPPRRGLDEKTRKIIKKIAPKTICYVSCDPATLARDLKEFQGIYEIEKITPVDMFPNTPHVECVCVLKYKKTIML